MKLNALSRQHQAWKAAFLPMLACSVLQAFASAQKLRVAGIPAATDMVTIFEGTPYTVPNGKMLVITGVSRSGVVLVDPNQGVQTIEPTFVDVHFDRVPVISATIGALSSFFQSSPPTIESAVAIPAGVVAPPGTSVSVVEASIATPLGPPVPTGYVGVIHGYLFNPRNPGAHIPGIPAPDQMVRITEGTTLTVPTGKRFVVTGVGRDLQPVVVNTPGEAHLPVNSFISILANGFAAHTAAIGQSEYLYGLYGRQCTSIQAIPPGLVFDSGTVIEALELTVVLFNDGYIYVDPFTLDETFIETDVTTLEPTAARGVILGYLEPL